MAAPRQAVNVAAASARGQISPSPVHVYTTYACSSCGGWPITFSRSGKPGAAIYKAAVLGGEVRTGDATCQRHAVWLPTSNTHPLTDQRTRRMERSFVQCIRLAVAASRQAPGLSGGVQLLHERCAGCSSTRGVHVGSWHLALPIRLMWISEHGLKPKRATAGFSARPHYAGGLSSMANINANMARMAAQCRCERTADNSSAHLYPTVHKKDNVSIILECCFTV